MSREVRVPKARMCAEREGMKWWDIDTGANAIANHIIEEVKNVRWFGRLGKARKTVEEFFHTVGRTAKTRRRNAGKV